MFLDTKTTGSIFAWGGWRPKDRLSALRLEGPGLREPSGTKGFPRDDYNDYGAPLCCLSLDHVGESFPKTKLAPTAHESV